MLTADAAVSVIALGVAAGGLLTGCDAVANRALFSAGGLLDARLGFAPRVNSALMPLPGPGAAVPIGAATATSSVVLGGACLTDVRPIMATAAVALTVCVIAQAMVLGYGRDGSDEMAVVVSVPLAVALLAGSDGLVADAALVFIAAQLGLSYLTAGLWKLAGSMWRDGTAAARVAATRSYGLARVGHFLGRHPVAACAATWGTVAVECLFVPAMFVGGAVAVIALAAMALFHVQAAVVLGLNRFTPWFLAAYPAALWATERVGLLS